MKRTYTVKCPDDHPPCRISVFEYSPGQWHAQIIYEKDPGEPFVGSSPESVLAEAATWDERECLPWKRANYCRGIRVNTSELKNRGGDHPRPFLLIRGTPVAAWG